MADIFLLDWHETKHGVQPKPDDVYNWLTAHGYKPIERPKVYAIGTVKVEVENGANLEANWPAFEPIPQTGEDKLGGYVRSLIEARAEVLRIPESRRNAIEQLALSTAALLLYGYGVEPDA